jgi:hypothetical protein
MVKKIIQAGLIALLISLSTTSISANQFTINDLVNNSKRLNKNIIVIEAEVIGEELERGEYSWLNVNDQTNAIGVWVKQEDADQLVYYGDYHHIGDKVRIIGQFNQACSEHGGEMDIHATAVTKIEDGYQVIHPVSQTKIYVTLGLLIVALFLGIKNYKLILFRRRNQANNE